MYLVATRTMAFFHFAAKIVTLTTHLLWLRHSSTRCTKNHRPEQDWHGTLVHERPYIFEKKSPRAEPAKKISRLVPARVAHSSCAQNVTYDDTRVKHLLVRPVTVFVARSRCRGAILLPREMQRTRGDRWGALPG